MRRSVNTISEVVRSKLDGILLLPPITALRQGVILNELTTATLLDIIQFVQCKLYILAI